MRFVNAASVKEVELGRMKGVEVGGKSILLVNLAGKHFAIGNVCTHMGCMLSDGVLKEGHVECPCHGSVFDVKTGKVVEGPAMKPEPAYQAKVEGDRIMVKA